VGGVFPNEVELEKSLIERAKVIVEFKDRTTYKGKAQHVPKEKIYADLSDIMINVKDARVKNDEVTIFDSVGFAMEDLETYKLIYELATAEGIRKRVNIAGRPKYPKNLYEPLLS
jgi:ornithine cyclodeaminase